MSAPKKCQRCGVVTDRHHLRHLAGCSHGADCCPPAPQFEALVVREMRILMRELDEALAAAS